MKTLRLALPGVALAACLLAPFLDKAFTVDDTVFLLEAQHLLVDPLHPTAFEIVWYEAPARLSTMMASGPLTAYLLLPAVAAGGAEWIGHLVVLGLLALAVVATVALAGRLGLAPSGARNAGLLLAATPAVIGMAGTCMPDVPAMAFGVLGMERLLAWRDEARWSRGIVAAVALALAILTRSHLVLLLPLGALALWLARPAGDSALALARRLLPLAVVLPLLWLGLRLTADPQREGGVARAIESWATLTAAQRNLLALLVYFAFALPLSLPWLGLHAPRMGRRWGLLGLLLIGLARCLAWAVGEGDRAWLVALGAGLSALAFAHLFADALRRREPTRLLLCAWLLIAAPVVLYVQLAPKYLIASAPALAILLADEIARAPLRLGRLVGGLSLGAGALLGLLIVRADAELAGLGRRAAVELIAPRVRRGERVWFAGHWGFQWYAEQAGARPLVDGVAPSPGDVIVASSVVHGHQMLERVADRELVESLVGAPGGRVMGDGAGFFSNHWGFMPWWWGSGYADRFTVWRVGPPTARR